MREPIAPSPRKATSLILSSYRRLRAERRFGVFPFRRACSKLQRALARLDPDRLGIHKRVRSEVRQLSTITAVLDTADGNSRIRR